MYLEDLCIVGCFAFGICWGFFNREDVKYFLIRKKGDGEDIPRTSVVLCCSPQLASQALLHLPSYAAHPFHCLSPFNSLIRDKVTHNIHTHTPLPRRILYKLFLREGVTESALELLKYHLCNTLINLKRE